MRSSLQNTTDAGVRRRLQPERTDRYFRGRMGERQPRQRQRKYEPACEGGAGLRDVRLQRARLQGAKKNAGV